MLLFNLVSQEELRAAMSLATELVIDQEKLWAATSLTSIHAVSQESCEPVKLVDQKESGARKINGPERVEGSDKLGH